jgi:hypothetical protein
MPPGFMGTLCLDEEEWYVQRYLGCEVCVGSRDSAGWRVGSGGRY